MDAPAKAAFRFGEELGDIFAVYGAAAPQPHGTHVSQSLVLGFAVGEVSSPSAIGPVPSPKQETQSETQSENCSGNKSLQQ